MLSRILGTEERQHLINIIREETCTTAEVLEILRISRQRLQDFKRTGKLEEIKKGIFLKHDVAELRSHILNNTIKHQKDEYSLVPVIKDLSGILLINTLRFFDCCTMITRSNKEDEDILVYKDELFRMLNAINANLSKSEPIYFLFNKNDKFKFDNIETVRDLYESNLIKSELTFESSHKPILPKAFLKDSTAPIYIDIEQKNIIDFLEGHKNFNLGLEQVKNFDNIYESILTMQKNYKK
ncbi:helix-turn-helix domain-containing protein [Bacillus mycoides]|uniref:helix-turn-helix domain-containing protein n=1 Tax=Bacillus mycoides TaxID=1405 RepID=UPI001C010CD4|nr:helix-turn-helix domain-containing protein [Bacillus mycoides]QWH75589.1 DNA-binding protein [Bacillus mycoides]